jgi:hypothetical protein
MLNIHGRDFGRDLGIVEDLTGKNRKVRCSVSSFANVCAIVDGTAMLATIPELVAVKILRMVDEAPVRSSRSEIAANHGRQSRHAASCRPPAACDEGLPSASTSETSRGTLLPQNADGGHHVNLRQETRRHAGTRR